MDSDIMIPTLMTDYLKHLELHLDQAADKLEAFRGRL
jgi:hypothetical protein